MRTGGPKPLNLPFDPIERAAAIWRERFGESSAMAAVTSIMRAHQILLAQLDTLLRPYDLTFARYEALVLLTFSRTGALPLSKIGERLMVHPTSVTNTVSRLERAGLVRRRRNPRDGRGVLAEITDVGRERVRARHRRPDGGGLLHDHVRRAGARRAVRPAAHAAPGRRGLRRGRPRRRRGASGPRTTATGGAGGRRRARARAPARRPDPAGAVGAEA